MAAQCYECMFLFDSNKYARDAAGVVGQITKLLEKCHAETLVSRLWTEQKLAYPIKNHRKGTYWLALFKMSADQLVAFNRECQLNESLLRHLVIRIDPRLTDAIVEHARTGHAAPATGELGDRPRRDLPVVPAGIGDE